MALTIRGIAVPLAPSIDQEYLRIKHPFVVMGEVVRVAVIVRTNGAPRELAVVAAVMQRRRARRCSDDRQVRLVIRPYHDTSTATTEYQT